MGAIENPLIHIIGHPDDSRLPADYDTLAAAAKEHHTLLEVNNSSLTPGSVRVGAADNYAKLLERCAHYGTSIIMGSDAHSEADAGNHLHAIKFLEELQFPQASRHGWMILSCVPEQRPGKQPPARRMRDD